MRRRCTARAACLPSTAGRPSAPRALDAGQVLLDPTRQRVEAVIEASREAEGAALAGGADLFYGGGDDDEAEHL